jgi:drug/metabolite transporter (DMT)-like permease
VLRTQKLTWRLAAGLAVGIAGVAVLMNPSSALGEAPLDRRGVVALIVACWGWSIGTIVTPRVTLPKSKAMAAAMQMFSGGVQLLLLAAIAGEFGQFHPRNISAGAWFSLFYLITAGSILAFTAYVWLLHYESPTKVGTYAYVNPIVAVILGAALGGEAVGRRTLFAACLILVSVAAITTMKAKASSTNERVRARLTTGD